MKATGMQYRLWIWIALLMCLELATSPANAAERTTPRLTLSQAIAAALKTNPEMQAVRYQMQAVASQVTQARSGLLPQLDVAETFNRTNSPLWAFGTKLNQGNIQSSDFAPDQLNDPEAINNFNTALTLSWNLFDGGRTWIGWRQAQKNKEATALGLQQSEHQVIAQAAKAYAGCLLAAKNLDVVVQAQETARAHLKVVRDRFGSGLVVKSDLLRAQVRIADLEQQRLMAESQLHVALAMLKAVMGQPEVDDPALTTALEAGTATPGELAHWVDQALDRRPDLKQLQIQEEIARQAVARARAEHWPALALQGNYEINSEDFNDSKDSYTVGAVLKLNLYSGQRISAQTAAAKAMLSRIQALRKGLALNVRVQTQKAFFQAQSAWQSIQVAQIAVEQADEGLRIVANRYQSGLLTLVSLLDAQVALQRARTQHFKALHDYQVARIDLALATGVIDKDFK